MQSGDPRYLETILKRVASLSRMRSEDDSKLLSQIATTSRRIDASSSLFMIP